MNTALLKDARYNEGHYQTHCDYTFADAIYDWDNVVQKYPRRNCDLNSNFQASADSGAWECNSDRTWWDVDHDVEKDLSGNWVVYRNYKDDRRNTMSVDTPKNFNPAQDPTDRITGTGWRNQICNLPKLNCQYYIGYPFP